MTPFAAAMTHKNNRAAQKILELEPQAAEQHDARGRNFLHSSVMRADLESVLFLLSVSVDVNSRTQDANLLTPLFLAVQVRSHKALLIVVVLTSILFEFRTRSAAR